MSRAAVVRDRLPLGRNVVMPFATDPAKQKAAWEYIKVATGPIGATMMVAQKAKPDAVLPHMSKDVQALLPSRPDAGPAQFGKNGGLQPPCSPSRFYWA